MNNSSTPARVNYFDKQFLRLQEFTDEQGYQVALRRRHNIAHHSWGIVVGLELAAEEGRLVVRPGMAIDGYGRELFLPARTPINTDEFLRLGSNRLDVWLFYERENILKPPAGYVACGEDVPDNYLRVRENPRVFLERARASRIDGRKPKLVSPAILNSIGELVTTDDPLKVWPVYLGRITYLREEKDPLKQFLIDVSDRPYAGIVAEVVEHPASAARIELGQRAKFDQERIIGDKKVTYAQNGRRAFAVFVPGEQDELEPQFEMDLDDNNFLRGTTTLYGNLILARGVVQFTEGTAAVDEAERKDPSIYRSRAVQKKPPLVNDELRVDLGFMETNERAFVIGHTTEDGSFRAAVKLEFITPPEGNEPQPLLTIYGDLKLEGLIQSAGTKERTLNDETLQALLASFQSGMGAAQKS